MKVTFERLVGPEYLLPIMQMTDGKKKGKKKYPKIETWGKMLLSEHSPSRIVRYLVKIEDIPYYAHVYLTRHHIGVQPYVLSQRDDEGFKEVTSRDDLPQGSLVNMYLDINAQAILTISKWRACYKSHRVIQNFITKLKMELINGVNSDEYDHVLGKLMMKRCEWNGGLCQEPRPCGRVPGVRNAVDVHKHLLEVDNE